MNRLDKHRERMHKQANSIGNFLVEGFHYLGLFAIGGAIAIASVRRGGTRWRGHLRQCTRSSTER